MSSSIQKKIRETVTLLVVYALILYSVTVALFLGISRLDAGPVIGLFEGLYMFALVGWLFVLVAAVLVASRAVLVRLGLINRGQSTAKEQASGGEVDA